jgi:prepilin-type N-terminal cleavage/methylation domain-containing protein/prepilin-type processing-associated H-X9-DG protein
MDMKPRREFKVNSQAFSLVELLIVAAILGVLYVMAFSPSSAQYQRAKKQLCEANLEKIHVAMQLYANDYGGWTPAATNAATSESVLAALVPKYSADTDIFICPGGRDNKLASGTNLKQGKMSYAYYMGRELGSSTEALLSDRQVNTNRKSSNDDLFSATGQPPGNNHKKYGGNVLFSDGHVEMSPAAAAFPLDYPTNVTLLNPKP